MAGLFLGHWTTRFPQTNWRRNKPPRRHSTRLRVETLEGRCLPSTVTNLLDNGPGSLRQAILDTPAGGTVDFQPGLSGTIDLPYTNDQLFIDKDLTIAGPGADAITVSGDNTTRVFVTGAQVTISGLTIADGREDVGSGGGIYNSGTLTLTDCVVRDNHIFTDATGFVGGGGIYNANFATLTITRSTLSDNSSMSFLGINEGGGIGNFGTLTIVHSTLTGNSAQAGFGGAVYSGGGTVAIADSTLSGNSAFDGGGIDNVQGKVSITGSTLSGNSGRLGGGIGNSGTLTITDSALSGNTATSPTGVTQGGGISNFTIGTLTITDCTFSGNSAGNFGGGIYNDGVVSITSATLSGNSARTGGGINSNSGTVTVQNTLVADNTAGAGPDVSGLLTSRGHNLIGDGTGGGGYDPTDLVGTSRNPIDPVLGPLQDNGRPSWTEALLAGSPALNSGDQDQLGSPDQRGVFRTGGVNIGAYQASASSFVVAAPELVGSGVPFDVTITAVDVFGQTAVGYTATVNFSTTDPDPGVVLPADYTFTPDDGGSHTFTNTGLGEITLITPGDQTITVTDTTDHTITASVTVTVGEPGTA